MKLPATMLKASITTVQMASCVRPTNATPIILPIISWNGLHELTMTSTMRLVFSSMTPFMIMEPYISTNI